MQPTLATPSSTARMVPNQDATTRFARLNVLAPVGLSDARCLHLQKPWVECRACVEACPVRAMTAPSSRQPATQPETLAVDATACTGCGRCASACPTGALAVDGFDLTACAPTAGFRSIACRTQATVPGNSIRVPCLGGLHPNDVLALLAKHPDLSLHLMDCDAAACASAYNPASALPTSPARRLHAAIEPLLRSSCVPADRVTFGDASSALPNSNDPTSSDTPNRTAARATSRRAFFSGLSRAAARSVVDASAGHLTSARHPPVDVKPRAPIDFSRARETRLLMQDLAKTTGADASLAWLPQAAVSPACRTHGTCAAVCPTGALSIAENGATRSLVFDAWQCIDCAACADACPESALRLEVPAWRAFATSAVTLARVTLRSCPRCAAMFAGSAAADSCDACTKSAALSRAGFTLFAGLRHFAPVETGPP